MSQGRGENGGYIKQKLYAIKKTPEWRKSCMLSLGSYFNSLKLAARSCSMPAQTKAKCLNQRSLDVFLLDYLGAGGGGGGGVSGIQLLH